MIFDDFVRSDLNPAAPDECHFSFLNRSAWSSTAHVRDLLSEWVSNYPSRDRSALTTRLRSNDDEQHLSAFFELALHEFLLRTQHTICAIEPPLEHTTSRPDFLVESSSGSRFYVEAAVVTGRSTAVRAANARLARAPKAVDEAICPHHFLDVDIDGSPSQTISGQVLQGRLNAWIAELPTGGTTHVGTPFVFSQHGTTFTIRAIPRSKTKVERGRAIGMQSRGARWVTSADEIREKVARKARKYGSLDAPLIVAVNAVGDFHSREDVIDALLGSQTVNIRTFEDGSVASLPARALDGVWFGANGPRKRGLSAVLATIGLYPWSVASRQMCLVRNPWAARVLPPAQFRTDELNPHEGVFLPSEGERLGDVFGLPDGWPGLK